MALIPKDINFALVLLSMHVKAEQSWADVKKEAMQGRNLRPEVFHTCKMK